MWLLSPRAVAGWCVWDVLSYDNDVVRLLLLPELLFPFFQASPFQSDQQTLLNIHNVGFASPHDCCQFERHVRCRGGNGVNLLLHWQNKAEQEVYSARIYYF